MGVALPPAPHHDLRVRLRPETRRKIEHVCQVKRWKYIEAVDAALDALIAHDPDFAAQQAEAKRSRKSKEAR
jgi:hypothetical protein